MLGPDECYEYLLASRFVIVYSEYTNWHCGSLREGFVGPFECLCGADGYMDFLLLYLRPIVHLESEVTEEQVPIIQPQNDNWTEK